MISEWISSNRLFLLLAAGAIFSFGWLLVLKDRLHIKWYAALLAAVLHTIYGVLTVKAFAVIEGFGDLSVVGNMSLFGGVFFMPLAYWAGAKLFRRSIAEVFDVFTICMVFTVMCARINCIFAGCCFGNSIPGLENLRWPTRELEIVFYAALLIVLGRKVLAGKTHGEIYPVYMISYGIFRFVIEGFRFQSGASLIHLAHIWALISLCLGLSIYAEIQKKRKKRGGR